MQKLIILGATGNLGTQTLDIIQKYPHEFQVVGMSAGSNREALEELGKKLRCENLVLAHQDLPRPPPGRGEGLIDESIDHLMVLDHGAWSLGAVLKALAMKKRVSIANKELLIMHGEDIAYLAKERCAELIPLDSEHNAIFQCLAGEKISSVKRLILTASGGPFRNRKWEDLNDVTPDEVLQHPKWKMGAKTTVDSATLVNKALEVIEAHHLFGIAYDQIEVRLHPESIVHAIVEFTDGTSKMLAYPPDMKFSLGYALFYPDRAPMSLSLCHSDRSGGIPFQSFSFDQDFHFEKIESGRFPCFDLVLNIAKNHPECLAKVLENDQRAIVNFLAGKIGYTEIFSCLLGTPLPPYKGE